jgi:hypothetical protein
MNNEPILYLAITGHGFGHAVRVSCVAQLIKEIYPETLLIFATTTPRWLIESYVQADFIYRPRSFDVGVVQSDSLRMDKAATLEKMEQIYRQQGSIIAGEVDFIRTNRVSLILADIPPLAPLIAKAAGIPCWMMSNFGWDFIYQDWGEDFLPITDWIRECYQKSDRLFRLPLCEAMTAFPHITDVGLTGGTPRHSKEHLRNNFNLSAPQEKTVLLTFGGLGLEAIPYHHLKEFPDWQFITFDRLAPNLANLVKVEDNHYRPVDFMPLCGRVVSKPGYSTFAESLLLDIPLISLTRDDFAEAEILLEGIKNYAYHQLITPKEFYEGANWDFLRQEMNPPLSSTVLDKNGVETIAKAVVDYLKSRA